MEGEDTRLLMDGEPSLKWTKGLEGTPATLKIDLSKDTKKGDRLAQVTAVSPDSRAVVSYSITEVTTDKGKLRDAMFLVDSAGVVWALADLNDYREDGAIEWYTLSLKASVEGRSEDNIEGTITVNVRLDADERVNTSDIYDRSKAFTESFLDVTLLTTNATKLNRLRKIPGAERDEAFIPILVLLVFEILLQIVLAVMLIILANLKFNNQTPKLRMQRKRRMTIATGTFIIIIFALNAIVTAFEADSSGLAGGNSTT